MTNLSDLSLEEIKTLIDNQKQGISGVESYGKMRLFLQLIQKIIKGALHHEQDGKSTIYRKKRTCKYHQTKFNSL